MGWQRWALGLEGVALEKGEDVNELRAATDRYLALHEKELRLGALYSQFRLAVILFSPSTLGHSNFGRDACWWGD